MSRGDQVDRRKQVSTLGTILAQALAFTQSFTAGVVALALASSAGGCAGGAPQLHPAHVLKQGRVRFGAGVGGRMALGGISQSVRRADNHGPTGLTGPDAQYVEGLVASNMASAGAFPFVSARTGLGQHWEAGLAYTGRQASVDIRHAWQDRTWAFSIGAGAGALLHHVEDTSAVQGAHLEQASGWSARVPVLVGWKSQGGVAWAWWGVRGAYERLSADVVLDSDPQSRVGTLTASAASVEGIVGLAIGSGDFHAALELDGGWMSGRGSAWDQEVSFSGLTLTPSAALLGEF